MTRLTIALFLFLPLSACDSSGGGSSTVTVDAITFRALGDCDSSTNPGDYQFQVTLVDGGNNPITSRDFPAGSSYGTWTDQPANYILLNANSQVSAGGSVSAAVATEQTGGFGVQVSGTEWDSSTVRDSDFDNVSQTRAHPFVEGRFTNVIGTQSIQIGRNNCRVTMEYQLAIQ